MYTTQLSWEKLISCEHELICYVHKVAYSYLITMLSKQALILCEQDQYSILCAQHRYHGGTCYLVQSTQQSWENKFVPCPCAQDKLLQQDGYLVQMSCFLGLTSFEHCVHKIIYLWGKSYLVHTIQRSSGRKNILCWHVMYLECTRLFPFPLILVGSKLLSCDILWSQVNI